MSDNDLKAMRLMEALFDWIETVLKPPITNEEVFRALAEGFPDGATCHVGVRPACARSVYPLVVTSEATCIATRFSIQWSEIDGIAPVGKGIGPYPARSYVPIFGPDFKETLEKLEAERG